MGVVCFSFISIRESHILPKFYSKILHAWQIRRKGANLPCDQLDSDVVEEKKRVDELISSTEFASSNLIVHNLTKSYGNVLAVNRLSMAVTSFECFGLLGVNGAGKTTTFKVLTGDEHIFDGDAWACGASIKHNLSSVYKRIAYCPQFDAFFEDLTARETLEVFGLMHGIRNINAISPAIATKFNFSSYLDKKVSAFSGGNKRKLSTALAFLGNRSLVYLDEPTAGMDPETKRRIWNIISKERSFGKTIVLTSHSMDECEALCSRLTIMVRGEFKCIGSMQHLKNKFSQGYDLSIKVRKTVGQR